MNRITKTLASSFAGALLSFAAATAGAATDPAAATPAPVAPAAGAGAAQEKVDPATLRLVNRDVVTFRASLSGVTPEQRVERARARIRALPLASLNEPIRAMPATLGDARGVQFLLGDFLLFAVLEGDVDTESRQSFEALVKQTQVRLEEVRTAWHQLNDRPLLIQGLVKALVATVVLALLVVGLHRGAGRLVAWMEKKRDVIAAVHPFVDWREFLARLAVGSMQIFRWLALIALGYAWLTYVLSSFILTAPIAGTLGHWLWDKVVWLGEGVVASLPGLATVFIVLAFTRAVVGVLRYFFDAVQRDRLRLPMFHPETATASRRIVTLIAWALGIAVAYPYLPGSNSEAFKGLSVLFGLMITLGSAGLVTQAMGGLVVVYSRALRKGDYVDINGVQGVVSEVAALATKVVNVRNEEITIPNSVVISTPIRNYSKLAGTHGTLITTKVTIGYDAPWRQVHALLIGAAQKTPGVRADPRPYVYQVALSDFYVEYELFCSIDRPLERVPVLSALHSNIQDMFNEAGVQIMSPHFLAQPGEAVLVPKAHWYAPPAQPPAAGA
jgi:small-conductance mechanosensitive channel